jgi:transposase
MPKPSTPLPDSHVIQAAALEKRTRRKFNLEYKLRMLSEAGACRRGELDALLRRERLYSGQLRQWRHDFAQDGVQGLSKSLPGPASRTTPEQRQIAQLEKDKARLTRKLQIAEDCLELQKKYWRCSNSPGFYPVSTDGLKTPGNFRSCLATRHRIRGL